MYTELERSVACLKGLATGDALGKQTENLKRSDVKDWYPKGITGFHGELGSVIPRSTAKHYLWCVGETTDDTEQTVAIARILITDGTISHSSVGRALMKCRKSNHIGVSLGRFQQRGDPDFVSSEGAATIRVAPIGIVYAAAVSVAVDGKLPDEVLDVAIGAAHEAERFRPPSSTGNMAEALRRMHAELAPVRQKLPMRLQKDDCFPNTPAAKLAAFRQ